MWVHLVIMVAICSAWIETVMMILKRRTNCLSTIASGIAILPGWCRSGYLSITLLNVLLIIQNFQHFSILGTLTRILTSGSVGMYTSCHEATFVMTNCTIVSQKCSSTFSYSIWSNNEKNWCHNSHTVTTCNRKYTWLPWSQQ